MTKRKSLRSGAIAAALVGVLSSACSCSAHDGDSRAERKEVRDGLTVVWLAGSHLEMGRQHGRLLREELASGVEFIERDVVLQILLRLSKKRGLMELAYQLADQEVIDECTGLVEEAGDVGWTMDMCMLLAFGDVASERIEHPETAPGCSQFVALGDASRDSRIYHGRLMDWFDNQFILDHPTVFVRGPVGGIPHVSIAWPGAVTPFTGMNEQGLSIAMNNADPHLDGHGRDEGLSHQHLMARLLRGAGSLAEAEQMIYDAQSLSTESIVIADGKSRTAAAFEMGFDATSTRLADDSGVLYQTNHFVAPATAELDLEPVPPSSQKRFDRLGQLLDARVAASRYGQMDQARAVEVLRDRVDPWSKLESAESVFDDDSTLATNGALLVALFAPETLEMWVAGGALPVPSQRFVHFSLPELFGEGD